MFAFLPLLMHDFKPSTYFLNTGKHLKCFLHWPLSFRSDFSPIPFFISWPTWAVWDADLTQTDIANWVLINHGEGSNYRVQC